MEEKKNSEKNYMLIILGVVALIAIVMTLGGSNAVKPDGCGTTPISPFGQQQQAMWIDFDSLRAASLIAGFETELPENPLADEYPNDNYRAFTDVMVEVYYTNDAGEDGVRFGKAHTCDGREVYEPNITFRSTNIVDVGDLEVTERGDGETISMATWAEGEYSYGILTLDDPVPKEVMENMIRSFK